MPNKKWSNWTLFYPEPDVACLQLDTPDRRINLLTEEAIGELDQALDQLDSQQDLTGLILASAKPNHFLAGADVHALKALLSTSRDSLLARLSRGQSTMARLSQRSYVTVALIDGVCLGGGAELACWCDRRVLSDSESTRIGFPEVELDLIPGWGGIARLPRIIGLSNAVRLMIQGKQIDGNEARSLGLADELVSGDSLMASAIALIRLDRQGDKLRKLRHRMANPLPISVAELDFLIDSASRAIDEKRQGRRLAPKRALALLRETAQCDVPTSCRQTSEAFADLFGSPTHRSLLNVFFLREHNRHWAATLAPKQATQVDQVGVIGAGIMGISIAAANIRHRVPVRMFDASAEALERGIAAAPEEATQHSHGTVAVHAGTPHPQNLVRACRSLDDLADCQLIVESIVENVDVKRRLYKELESSLADDAVLASNTSTILISSLAEFLNRPERFCGMHFFNPVRYMRLVEVIRGNQTSDETIATAVAHARRIGKMPIAVNDSPGFLVNRLLSPYLNESLQMLCEGVEIQLIDQAAVEFGMPIGPLAVYDMVGIDTSMYAGMTMLKAFPDRIKALPVLPALFKAGRLGRKSGAGFYRYASAADQGRPDPEAAKLLDPYIRPEKPLTLTQITERLLLPMLLEATRVLEAEIVTDVRDVDLSMIFALGFPADRGGLLFWADSLGAGKIVEMLKPYESRGVRYRPTEMLLDMARTGRGFYDRIPA